MNGKTIEIDNTDAEGRLPQDQLLPVGGLNPQLPGIDEPLSLSVTAISSRPDGLSYAIGTSTGHTLLYDIRSARPFATKDQGYGLPVQSLSWIEGGSRMAGDGLVLSADRKVIKIWDRNSVCNIISHRIPRNAVLTNLALSSLPRTSPLSHPLLT